MMLKLSFVTAQPQPQQQLHTYQSYSLQPLFKSFLSLSLSEYRLQPADQLCCKPLRLHVNILWHAVRALQETEEQMLHT